VTDNNGASDHLPVWVELPLPAPKPAFLQAAPAASR